MPRRIALLVFTFMMGVTFLTGYLVMPKEKVDKKIQKANWEYEVLSHQEELDAKYYGTFTKDQTSDRYVKVNMKYKKNDSVLGHHLGKAQNFSCYLKVTGPTTRDVIKRKVAENVAYSLVLRGDLVKAYDKKTNQSMIFIDNASINYMRIPYNVDDNMKVTYVINGVRKSVSKDIFEDALNDLTIRKGTLNSRRTSESDGRE